MPSTFTYTFPEETINNEGDTLQLLVTFVNDNNNPEYFAAEDHGLRVMKYGDLSISYDLEDAFLVPSSMSFIIGDSEGVFDNLFFINHRVTDRKAQITLKKNGSNVFIGNVLEDSIESDEGTKTVRFDAAPQTDLICKRMIFDDENNALNPFNYTSNNYYHIIDILEDLFGLVNPSISYDATTLEIIHDWEFQGQRDTNACYLNDIVFEEIYQYINPLYFLSEFGLRNCGDVLKKLAIDWGCFTGFISYEKAFFKQLFHYNSNNLQTVTVYNRRKNYKYGLIDYVKFTTNISSPVEPYEEGTFTEIEGRFLTRKSLPAFFSAVANAGTNVKAVLSPTTRTNYYVFNHGSTISDFPSEGAEYINNGSTFKVKGTVINYFSAGFRVVMQRIEGINTPSSSGTLTKSSGVGPDSITFDSYGPVDGTYSIYQAREPNLFNNALKDFGALSARFWYTYRGNLQNCRVDHFVFKGINYDFLKDFNYGGSKYQPISMKFIYSQNITECEAIYLGELE